jgi:hypothetical protein
VVEQALALPKQRFGYLLLQRCRAELALLQAAAAVQSCQRALSDEDSWWLRAHLVAAFALAQDERGLATEVATLRRLEPELTLARIKALMRSNLPKALAQQEAGLMRGLMLAGIPEA